MNIIHAKVAKTFASEFSGHENSQQKLSLFFFLFFKIAEKTQHVVSYMHSQTYKHEISKENVNHNFLFIMRRNENVIVGT
jgi:hypothetical protein